MASSINIDDDVFALAQEVAKLNNLTVGEVVSRISREHLVQGSGSRPRTVVPSSPYQDGSVQLTSDHVRQIEEDCFWEEYLRKEANSR